ncbi:SSI family serine proteinase inhibitor [Streptomyces sp. NPDC055078]
MLRRIILTATASAAVFAATVPVAGAEPLPFPVPLPLLSAPDHVLGQGGPDRGPGHGRGQDSRQDRRDRQKQKERQDWLTVEVSESGSARTEVEYELECAPSEAGGAQPRAGGTHPEAEAACARLDELAREGRDPFAPVGQDEVCTQQFGGPETARVTGIWHGRKVDGTFARTNGCEISRWQTMEPVLPSTR